MRTLHSGTEKTKRPNFKIHSSMLYTDPLFLQLGLKHYGTAFCQDY